VCLCVFVYGCTLGVVVAEQDRVGRAVGCARDDVFRLRPGHLRQTTKEGLEIYIYVCMYAYVYINIYIHIHIDIKPGLTLCINP